MTPGVSPSPADHHLQSDKDDHGAEDLFQGRLRNCHGDPCAGQATKEEARSEQRRR